jgi:hypothetical protein
MLWSGDDNLVSVSITDGEHPCTSSPTDNGSGLSMEPAVGHTLLDARFNNHMHPVTNLKFLDDGGYGRQPALSQIFLELIPCLLTWTIVMCHCLISLLHSFYQCYVKAGNAGRLFQDLGKTRTGSA